MLSKKTRYAIVSLINLSKKYDKGQVQISDIAKEEKIPQRFLESILLELKKMGILGSKLGKMGGYFLLKPPAEINLLEIINHFEGSVAMLYCVSDKMYQPCEFCKNENNCYLKNVFREIYLYNSKKLKETTFDKLI
jgi:Rrf2 family protein